MKKLTLCIFLILKINNINAQESHRPVLFVDVELIDQTLHKIRKYDPKDRDFKIWIPIITKVAKQKNAAAICSSWANGLFPYVHPEHDVTQEVWDEICKTLSVNPTKLDLSVTYMNLSKSDKMTF